jgi:hypothetical protein
MITTHIAKISASILLILAVDTCSGQFNASAFKRFDFITGSGASKPEGITTGDLDLDGKPDVVVVNQGSNSISVFRNISAPNQMDSAAFEPKIDITTGSTTLQARIGDIDGDGLPDIVVSCYLCSGFKVFRNTSTSAGLSFATPIDVTRSTTNPATIALADIDGDGKLDVINTNFGAGSVSMLRNTGSSGNISFDAAYTLNTATSGDPQPRLMKVGDLNNDGKPDLVVVNYNGASIAVFTNNSSAGNLTMSRQVINVGALPTGVDIGDLNTDGKQDIVVCNYNSKSVSLLANNSSGASVSFGTQLTIPATADIYGNDCEVRDFDDDGKPDIAIINWESASINELILLKNSFTAGSLTASNFSTRIAYPTGLYPHSMTVADINIDGRPDILNTNLSSNNFSVHFNRTLTAQPTAAPGNMQIVKLNDSTVRIGMQKGNGDKRIILIKAGALVNASPMDSNEYAANPAFGFGAQIGSGNFVVYSDTGSSVEVSQLAPGIVYHFAAFEFNGGWRNSNYLLSPVLRGSIAIVAEPTMPAGNLTINQRTNTSLKVSFSAGNGSGRLVILKAASVPALPTDGQSYTGVPTFGRGSETQAGSYVVMADTAQSVVVDSLQPGTQYFVRVVDYNTAGTWNEYLTSSFLEGSAYTTNTPVYGASGLSIGDITNTAATVTVQAGSGRARLIVMRAGNPISGMPSDSIKYTADSVFGSGSEITDGGYCVLVSEGTTIHVSGLTRSTEYFISAFEFNGADSLPDFNTDSILTGSFTTRNGPSLASSQMVFTDITTTSMGISFTPGDGDRRLVVAKEGSAVSIFPEDAHSYAYSPVFASGANLGDNNYAISADTAVSVSVNGLSHRTMYHFAVFELNGIGSEVQYLISNYLADSQQTLLNTAVPNIAIGEDNFISPNPFRDRISLSGGVTAFSLFTAEGKMAYQWVYGEALDVSGLRAEVYTCVFVVDGKKLIYKLVKID